MLLTPIENTDPGSTKPVIECLLRFMIKDKESKRKIAQDWVVVRRLENELKSKKFLFNGRIFNDRKPDGSQNLPLILAYSALDQVLSQLIDEGFFICNGNRPPLGKKMVDSKGGLPWEDYDLVNKGKDDRNNLAHEGILVGIDDCHKYINAIEVELKAWEVI